MATKITVKRKIVYQGQEYANVDELPAEARQAYERAVAASANNHDKGLPTSKAKIVFNGQEYGSLDEMPADVRRMYDAIMAAVEESPSGMPGVAPTSAGAMDPARWPAGERGSSSSPGPIVPESSTAKLIMVLVAVGALLLILYLLGTGIPSR